MKLRFSGKKAKGQNQLNLTVRGLLPGKFQAATLIACFVSLGLILPGDFSRFKKTLVSASPQLLLTSIEQVADNLTVKILATESLGSGIILKQQGDDYIVVTNQHVLRAGKPPYRIQTVDGEIYSAKIKSTPSQNQYDLALLKFTAQNQHYQTAKFGSSSTLRVGEAVYAAGFPHQSEATVYTKVGNKNSDRPVLKSGRVTIILDRALKEGYQIGYTNDVKRGMSGGPLLNSRGEVVGINGKHAYPLWEAPDFYEDGSQLCPPLQALITRSSLAIPIETVMRLTPQLTVDSSSTYTIKSAISVDSDKLSHTAELIAQMQAEAEASKNCKLSQEADSSEANK